MAARIKRVVRLYALYARMDWLLLARDARTGLIYMLSDWVGAVSSVLGIALLAVRFDGIGGLGADEILWMLGFFTLAEGVTYMLLGGYNVLHISRRVARGQLDHMLIQPVPLWLQLLTEGFMPVTGASGVLTGLALTVVATTRLGLPVTPGWLLILAAYILAHAAVSAGLSFLAGTAAFYRPVSCEEISTVMLDALNATGKFPLGALPVWLRGLLCTALPVGLMAWFPSLLMLRKIEAPLALVWPVAAGAAFIAVAGRIFKRGLRHYALEGCPRYKAMGYRN